MQESSQNKKDVDVSVIIPTHNRKDLVIRLIYSILKSDFSHHNFEIIVIDDASVDKTYETLRNKFSNKLKILRNECERYKSGSVNVGVKESKGRFLLIIDDDNIVSPTMISKLMDALSSNKRIGIVGPVTLLLGTNTILYAGALYNSFGIVKFLYRGRPYNVLPKKPFSVDAIPNCFMIKKEVFEAVGGFDEIYFPIGDEDSEFMQRVRRKGLRIMIIPEAICYHPYVIIRPSFIRIYYLIRSKIFLLRRHFPHKYPRFILIFPAYLMYYMILALVMSHNFKGIISFLKTVLLATIHGIFCKIGWRKN